MTTATAETRHTNPTENASTDVNNDNTALIGALGPAERYQVRDGIRAVAFTGWELGHISSERPTSTRWTEITIYRTEGGLYVAHRVGVSCVAHRADCVTIKGKNLPPAYNSKPDEYKIDEREPCEVCRPKIMADHANDPQSIRAEVDRHSAAVSETPEALINSLYTNQGGVRTLTGLASVALDQAAQLDERIAAAMSVAIEI